MMIALITFNSSLVLLIEGLRSSNPWEFEYSGFRRNRTNDLKINILSLWPTEARLHVRSIVCERVLAAAWWRWWICRIGAGLLPRVVISAKSSAPSTFQSAVAPLHATHTHVSTDFRYSRSSLSWDAYKNTVTKLELVHWCKPAVSHVTDISGNRKHRFNPNAISQKSAW